MFLTRVSARALALVAGTALVASCGALAPTAADGQPTAGTFQTKWVGSLDYGNFGMGYGNWAAPSWGGIYGFGGLPYGGLGYGNLGYGGLGYGRQGIFPVANDIYGGTTVVTSRGRIDRQPASLPLGVAEENDEAFRPVGSAIWQPK